MKNSYKLLIFGEHYSIVSDESSAQINKAAALLDSLLKEAASKLSQVDEKRIAILIALQMVNKALSLESQLESHIEQAQLSCKELIERIELQCAAIRDR